MTVQPCCWSWVSGVTISSLGGGFSQRDTSVVMNRVMRQNRVRVGYLRRLQPPGSYGARAALLGGVVVPCMSVRGELPVFGSASQENGDTDASLSLDFGPATNVLVGENDSGKTDIIDAIRLCLQYLISTIDHGFNASTFMARVIASTGADVEAADRRGGGALRSPPRRRSEPCAGHAGCDR